MFKSLLQKAKAEIASKEALADCKDSQALTAHQFSIESLPVDIQAFRVGSINSVYYVPRYIAADKQELLIKLIDALPAQNWVQLPHAKRRLQKLGGDVTESGLANVAPLPDFLSAIAQKLFDDKVIDKLPNHVLLNDYGSSSGIMPHTDGPLYYPHVCVISVGSGCTLYFSKDYSMYKERKPECSLYCEPGSLYIFAEEAYAKYLHAIDDRPVDEIFLAVMATDGRIAQIADASVDNYGQLDIVQQLKGLALEALIDEGRIGRVANNERFNYVLFSPRSRRISLTIRHVPEAASTIAKVV